MVRLGETSAGGCMYNVASACSYRYNRRVGACSYNRRVGVYVSLVLSNVIYISMVVQTRRNHWEKRTRHSPSKWSKHRYDITLLLKIAISSIYRSATLKYLLHNQATYPCMEINNT